MSSVGVLIVDPARHRAVSTTMVQTRVSSHVPVDLDDKLAQVEKACACRYKGDAYIFPRHTQGHKSLHNAL
jgi:hypothetical protein